MTTAVVRDGGLVQVDEIPCDDLDPGQISLVATRMRNMARNLRFQAGNIGTTWDKLPNSVQFPGVEPLYDADTQATANIGAFCGKLVSAASALDDFADEMGPIKATLQDIKTRARWFVSAMLPGNLVEIVTSRVVTYEIQPEPVPEPTGSLAVCQATDTATTWGTGLGPKFGANIPAAQTVPRTGFRTERVSKVVYWTESDEHVRKNNGFIDEIAEAYAKLHAIEVDCANRINALRDEVPERLVPVLAWDLKNSDVSLPWGAKVAESRSCGEQIADGFVKFGTDTVNGLGSLIGYNYKTGQWWDGDFAADAWSGVGDMTVTVLLGPNPFAWLTMNYLYDMGEEQTQYWDKFLDLGKGMLAWDDWSDAPAQAFTESFLNVGTMFIGFGSAASAISKVSKATGISLQGTRIGALATSISTKVNDVVIPITAKFDNIVAPAHNFVTKISAPIETGLSQIARGLRGLDSDGFQPQKVDDPNPSGNPSALVKEGDLANGRAPDVAESQTGRQEGNADSQSQGNGSSVVKEGGPEGRQGPDTAENTIGMPEQVDELGPSKGSETGTTHLDGDGASHGRITHTDNGPTSPVHVTELKVDGSPEYFTVKSVEVLVDPHPSSKWVKVKYHIEGVGTHYRKIPNMPNIPELARKKGLTFDIWSKIYLQATHNMHATRATLGPYTADNNSYHIQGLKDGDAVFNMPDTDWNELQSRYGLEAEHMFEIFNKPFLDELIESKTPIRYTAKPFLTTHNPAVHKYNLKTALDREYYHLHTNGYDVNLVWDPIHGSQWHQTKP